MSGGKPIGEEQQANIGSAIICTRWLLADLRVKGQFLLASPCLETDEV